MTTDLISLETKERQRAEAAGQGHVFDHWDALDASGRERLLEQLRAVDYELMERLGGLLAVEAGERPSPQLEPPVLFRLADKDSAAATAARKRGAELLAAGRVGFMIVAGGQGSRLGFEGPKGCFPIGPVTSRSLFAYHAARIQAAGRRHGFTPTWYVMTSPLNDADTRAFFEQNGFFGLGEANVFFFSQAMLPALALDGKLLLAEPDALFLAPNGHGGSLAALADSGALEHMRARDIDTISYFQVDNPLARPADPLFLGLHAEAGAGMSSKVVAKRGPDEKVGVIGRVDGALGCIEYSDLSDELREAKDESGELLFRAGNIAVHALDVGFVEELNQSGELDLPWHIARKRMRVLGADGEPAEVDGAKFETFVFDALAKSPTSVTLEVERAEEFSPVKNKDGVDSADSCRADLQRVFVGIAGDHGATLEVSPAFAETADEFAARGGDPEQHSGGLVFG